MKYENHIFFKNENFCYDSVKYSIPLREITFGTFTMNFDRRDFIKTAGGFAAAAAAYVYLPGIAFSASGSETAIGAAGITGPTFMSPEIITASSPINISIRSGVDLSNAWLTTKSGDKIELKKQGENGASALMAPASTPDPGMYDLYTEVTRGGKSRLETQPMAVKVVESFKDDFTFGVISDVHFGDPRLASKRMDYKVSDMLKKEIAILNENSVEFCICCGDLSFIPPKTKNEILEYAETLTGSATFPTFTVPGNHDGYASGAGGKITFDTLQFCEKTFGSMNYSRKYGKLALIGLNTFDKEPDMRNLYGGLGDSVDTGAFSYDQLGWLDIEMEKYKNETSIFFGHHNPTNTVIDVNGPFEIVPFSETGRIELLGLVSKHKPALFLNGHVHGFYEEIYEATQFLTAPTAASMPADGHFVGFLLVKVEGGKIKSWEAVEMLRV